MTNSNWEANEEVWRTVPPPLMPSAEDFALLEQASPPELLDKGTAPRILVLGVTPALIYAEWPPDSEIHAVDYDEVMIDIFWKEGENRQCHLDYWQKMPFPDDHFDLVVGDCSFNALPDRADYDDVLREVRRVSRPSTPMVCRFFMQPEPRLTLARLAEGMPGEFANYRIPSIRMLLMLAAAAEDGSLMLTDILRRIVEQYGDVDEYLVSLRHTPEDIARTKLAFGRDQLLNFPGWQGLLERFSPYYTDISIAFPGYDCGSFCPTVRFSP